MELCLQLTIVYLLDLFARLYNSIFGRFQALS